MTYRDSSVDLGAGHQAFLSFAGVPFTRPCKEFFTQGLELQADGLILRQDSEHAMDPASFLFSPSEV